MKTEADAQGYLYRSVTNNPDDRRETAFADFSSRRFTERFGRRNNLQINEIFQEGMMLQRQKPVRIWGTALPGQQISAEIQGRNAHAITAADGRWELTLPALEASDGETLVVYSGTERYTFEDVAVGEIWAACGQSNMEFPMGYEKNRDSALEGIAGSGSIRFYDVPKTAFDGQREAFDYSKVGIWRKAEPDDIPWFSAIGFYFAKELLSACGVPIGIVGCNWGGTRSAVWMSEDSVEQAGPVWMNAYREQSEGICPESFYEEQKKNPANDHGSILNPANDQMLPVTISMEEFTQMTGVGEETLLASVHYLTPEKIPGSLFHHMVEQLAPYTLRGILWYQGESDDELSGAQKCYGAMLEALIKDWRRVFKEPDLPFLVMQLANFRKWLCFENHDFAAIRRGQEQAVMRTQNAWLCANTDAGEELDIHPKDKRTPAHRLALLARRHVYGENVPADAPTAFSLSRSGQDLTITFRNAPDGLVVHPEDSLSALHILCEDRDLPFTWKIQGHELILHTEKPMTEHVLVQYAQEQWFTGSLYNKALIPALPFELRL